MAFDAGADWSEVRLRAGDVLHFVGPVETITRVLFREHGLAPLALRQVAKVASAGTGPSFHKRKLAVAVGARGSS